MYLQKKNHSVPKTIFILASILIFFSAFLVYKEMQKPAEVQAEGTYVNLGTADATDGGADAINFSQGRVWTIDQYGKYIWLTEDRVAVHHWTWSNDLGSHWTQGSENSNFLTRGSVAYDSIDDKLHVIWTTDTCDSGGGIIYRRYGITRDGSHNITDITREDSSNVNLQLDITGNKNCGQPIALWVNDGTTHGSLLALWTKFGSGIDEVRISKRTLSLSAADGVAGNWVAPDGSADTFSTDAPEVAADKIYGTTTGAAYASMSIRGGASAKKDDLYVFVNETTGASSDKVKMYRAAWNSGSSNWSGGWQSPVIVGTADNSSGYGSKAQLITRPVLDTTNDRLYVSWARWKTGGSGDTVSFAYLDSSDSPSSTVDVYSANGTHSYAPTVDIAFDNTLGQLYVAYIESTTNGDNGSIDYKTYDGSTLSGSTRFYTSPGGTGGKDGSADIPILYDSRSSNNRLLFAFRINGDLPPSAIDPHTIDFGYIALATPTNTPTPTPTPTNTNTPTPTSSQSTSLSNAGAPTCNAKAPDHAPWLVSGSAASSTSISLSYQDSGVDVTDYSVEYGTTPDSFQFAAAKIGGKDDRSITISSLAPNTLYYFRIRAGNDCAVGNWSNTLSVKTKSSGLVTKLVDITQSAGTPTPTPSPTGIEEPTEIPANPPTQEKKEEGYNLEVKVVDTKNNPVQGATVEVHSDVQTATTDEQGVAKFTNIEKGQHILSIAYAGYASEQSIYLQGDQNTIALTLQVEKKFQYFYLALIPVFILLGFFIAKRFSKKKEEVPTPSILHKI